MKNKNEHNGEAEQDLIFADQKILPISMEKEVKTSFIQYAMSVIMSRALPDVRDGLKPVHRRILYAMYEDHITYDKPFYKSATTVGNVLGRYHPHGDAAVYDAMVRLAQNFSLRYTLIDGHGNFGNIDGDQAAAYRYTEARLARLSEEMMRDIEKEVVDFTPNFDNKRREPVVLPCRFPNLLVNGSIGIAVGMATNIPPHNLCEVIDGTVYMMEHPDASVSELMQFIKGPDFPTAGVIYGKMGIRAAYETGHGRVMVRAKAKIEEEKHRIIFTEIPYMVNKSMLVESMADCVKDKRIEGITEIRDESGKDGMRIVVECRRDANTQVILNQLYKYTQLQDTCAINMLALVDNVPKVLGLRDILKYYIAHQEEVVTRRVKYDLDRALRDLHVHEGYRIAADHIDEVVHIIRASESVQDAKVRLMERFTLSEIQAQAIVDMTLGRLSGLERQKVIDKIAAFEKMIAEYRAILADENALKEIIREDLLAIRERYGDARRTELQEVENEIMLEDLIKRHTCVVTMTHSGYIKRQPADTYTAQRRGGKGIIGMTMKDEDAIEHVVAADSHAWMLLFTSRGRIHVRKAYVFPEAGRTAKGTNIVNILPLEEGERVTAMIPVNGFPSGEYLTMVTKHGVIKRTDLSDYAIQRRTGKIAITLDEGDELLFVRHTSGKDRIIIATRGGNAVCFDETDARVMGRTARGVTGIRMEEDDEVADAAIVEEDHMLLTVTENGYGKRSAFSDYPLHHRGCRGVRCSDVARTGRIAAILPVTEEEDILMMTSDGTIVRTPVSGIPVYSRTAGGVRVMRLSEGSTLVRVAKVDPEEKEMQEAEEAATLPVDTEKEMEALEAEEEYGDEYDEIADETETSASESEDNEL